MHEPRIEDYLPFEYSKFCDDFHRTLTGTESLYNTTHEIFQQKKKESEEEHQRVISGFSREEREAYVRALAIDLGSIPILDSSQIPKDVKSMLKFLREQQNLVNSFGSYEIMIQDMSLIYIIAEFESFITFSLHKVFAENPKLLKYSNKTIKLGQIVDLDSDSIGSLLGSAVGDIIHNVTNKDIKELCEYFKRRLSIDIDTIVDWVKFKERFYRRNIIVHNSGFPDQIYRDKVGYTGHDERLTVDMIYFTETIQLFKDMSRGIADKLSNKFATSSNINSKE